MPIKGINVVKVLDNQGATVPLAEPGMIILGQGSFGIVITYEGSAKCYKIAAGREGKRAAKMLCHESQVNSNIAKNLEKTPSQIHHLLLGEYWLKKLGKVTCPHIIFPLVTGNLYDLAIKLKQKPDLSDVLTQIKKALSFLHESGYAHTDIHDGNVLYKENGNERIFYLADLGLAQELQEEKKSKDLHDEFHRAACDTRRYVTNLKNQLVRLDNNSLSLMIATIICLMRKVSARKSQKMIDDYVKIRDNPRMSPRKKINEMKNQQRIFLQYAVDLYENSNDGISQKIQQTIQHLNESPAEPQPVCTVCTVM